MKTSYSDGHPLAQNVCYSYWGYHCLAHRSPQSERFCHICKPQKRKQVSLLLYTILPLSFQYDLLLPVCVTHNSLRKVVLWISREGYFKSSAARLGSVLVTKLHLSDLETLALTISEVVG